MPALLSWYVKLKVGKGPPPFPENIPMAETWLPYKTVLHTIAAQAPGDCIVTQCNTEEEDQPEKRLSCYLTAEVLTSVY
jgi:hypothetical protein